MKKTGLDDNKRRFCRTYLDTMDAEAAAADGGEMLGQKDVQRYLERARTCAALCALLQIGGDDFTQEAINRALSGCGITAEVAELPEQGCVRVTFPNTAGVPAEFDQIAGIILDIIPCHLETEFYFRYLTWLELEARFPTWESIEAGEYTWETLELAV